MTKDTVPKEDLEELVEEWREESEDMDAVFGGKSKDECADELAELIEE